MFGNFTLIREETREMWTFPRLESIAQEISAWWPARRGGMADPAASLRRE